MEELPPYSDCPAPERCEPAEGENLGIAFGLTIGAGLATNIGALLSFLPCFKRSNITLLAVGLALAAGFMVYVSFVDILGKTSEYFCCHTQRHYNLAATSCFFMGMVLTMLLQLLLDRLQKLDVGCSPPWSKKKKAKADRELSEQEGKKYSSMLRSLKLKLTGKNSDDDSGSKEEDKTIGIPTVTGEKSSETKFDSTAKSAEIVVITDETTDVSIILTL